MLAAIHEVPLHCTSEGQQPGPDTQAPRGRRTALRVAVAVASGGGGDRADLPRSHGDRRLSGRPVSWDVTSGLGAENLLWFA